MDTWNRDEYAAWLKGQAYAAGCGSKNAADSWPYIADWIREQGYTPRQVLAGLEVLGARDEWLVNQRTLGAEIRLALPPKTTADCDLCKTTPGRLWAVVATEAALWEVLYDWRWVKTLDSRRGTEWAVIDLDMATYTTWPVPCTCPAGLALAERDGWKAKPLAAMRHAAFPSWRAEEVRREVNGYLIENEYGRRVVRKLYPQAPAAEVLIPARWRMGAAKTEEHGAKSAGDYYRKDK